MLLMTWRVGELLRMVLRLTLMVRMTVMMMPGGTSV